MLEAETEVHAAIGETSCGQNFWYTD